MPVISVVPDRFKVQEKSLLGSAAGGATSGENHIRRPVRGIEIKEDSFATLRVVAGNGKTVPLVDAGSRRKKRRDDGKLAEDEFFEIDGKRATDIYSNFFIQNVNEERAEKQQILETFGEPFVFFFGERARIISFQGVLLNTFDFNWEAEWWYNYDRYLRGTKCVENDARIFLSFDETLVTGYIMAAAAAKNAQDKNFVNFQFQVFVTSNTNFSKIGDPNALPGLTNSDIGKENRATAASLSPFRPTIIDTNTKLGALGSMAVPGGALSDLSLVDGLAAGLDQVSQTFNTLKNQAEAAIKRLSDLANGTIIRVPVGFAGALEFEDNVDISTLREVTGEGVVKYSTFDQNTDEYVGTSDHYGSSVRTNGVVRVNDNVQEPITRNQKMIQQAQLLWAEQGFAVPPDDLGPVSTLLVKTGFGMAAFGSNAAWASELQPPVSSLDLSSVRIPGTGLIEE